MEAKMEDAYASAGIMQVSSTLPGFPHSDPSNNMFPVQHMNLYSDAQKSLIT